MFRILTQVKGFWAKCAKLVIYKHQNKIDMKRKEVMNKHLDFLLTQVRRDLIILIIIHMPMPVN
jgi:E1A-binding protein p400